MCVDRQWLQHRFELFETYCLPSISAQTSKNFCWIVMSDRRTPDDFLDRLRKTLATHCRSYDILLTSSDHKTEFRSRIKTLLRPDTTHLVTTRLDNDDAIHREFIARVQLCFDRQDYTFVEFLNGYTYDIHSSQLRSLNFPGNPFVSLIERVHAASTTVYCGMHRTLCKRGTMMSLSSPAAWMQIIHDRNIGNRTRGKPYKHAAAVLAEDFAIRTTKHRKIWQSLATLFDIFHPHRHFSVK
jgi:hypothetical protein